MTEEKRRSAWFWVFLGGGLFIAFIAVVSVLGYFAVQSLGGSGNFGDSIGVIDVDGVILTAPAVWGRATMDLLPRLALWAAVRLVPGLTVTGRGLEIKPSDNIPMLRALSRDPLVIKETRVDTIYGLVDLMDAALDSAPVLDVPLLVMYGAKDEIVPKTPIRLFVGGLPPESSTKNIWIARASAPDCTRPTILPVDWRGVTMAVL